MKVKFEINKSLPTCRAQDSIPCRTVDVGGVTNDHYTNLTPLTSSITVRSAQQLLLGGYPIDTTCDWQTMWKMVFSCFMKYSECRLLFTQQNIYGSQELNIVFSCIISKNPNHASWKKILLLFTPSFHSLCIWIWALHMSWELSISFWLQQIFSGYCKNPSA